MTCMTKTYEVEEYTSIRRLKEMYEEREGIAPEFVRFILAGKELEDARTMEDYNIGSETIIHVILRLRE